MRPCYGPLFPAPSAARASRARNKGTVTWAQEVIGEKLFFRSHVISARQIGARTLIAR